MHDSFVFIFKISGMNLARFLITLESTLVSLVKKNFFFLLQVFFQDLIRVCKKLASFLFCLGNIMPYLSLLTNQDPVNESCIINQDLVKDHAL